jgi:hypothetical protein
VGSAPDFGAADLRTAGGTGEEPVERPLGARDPDGDLPLEGGRDEAEVFPGMAVTLVASVTPVPEFARAPSGRPWLARLPGCRCAPEPIRRPSVERWRW